MAKPSRSSRQAPRRGRTSGARSRHASRGRRTASRVSWSRRLGIALALVVLGASAVLAGQALERSGLGNPTAEPPAGTPSLPAAPRLLPVASDIVASARVDLEVELAEALSPAGDYRLRVYVNEERVGEHALPAGTTGLLEGVPLERGANEISVAIAGPAGESLHSRPVSIVRDDVAPTIHVSSPRAEQDVITRQVLVRGRTEAGALLSLRNTANDENYELEVGEDGRFEQRLTLAMGRNVINLRATDAAGNRSRATLRLTRIESRASLSLEVRPETIKLADLPAALTLVARVQGLHGEPVDGAQVTFSISLPGQATSTFSVAASRGVAVWRDLRVPAEGALVGNGLATAMVILNEGEADELVLQQSSTVRFR